MGGITRGERVGRYELVRVLGEGGMGTVWLAHPYDAPEQLYAVKMVAEQYATDSRVCTMFVKEATLAAAIDHPNVVRLYDVGLHGDVPFFVMEWIDGYSLRDVARRVAETGERVPPSIALRIASDLCGGLHAAHELRGELGQPLGLVHRDVSPHNVLVTREGVPKLIDFGVAKARDLATGAEHSVYGGIKGKVRYMAPEQALAKEVDRRADLFSVGAIVYQLLTGRAPFEGPNELAIMNALLSSSPVFIPETLPEPVQWILRRALARRPENRFADGAEMQTAIELAISELGAPVTHADVAHFLAWFDSAPLASGEAPPHHGDTVLGMAPPGSLSPPPLAFETPAEAAPLGAVAATPPRTAPHLGDELAKRRRAHTSDKGSWRFVLLAAGFVGLLGGGAALLAKDGGPVHGRRPTAREPEPAVAPAPDLAVETAPLLEAPATAALPLLPIDPSEHLPIIDIGDLDEPPLHPKPKTETATKPRAPARRAPAAASKPRPPARKPAPARPATTSTASSKTSDLAGPIKVWK